MHNKDARFGGRARRWEAISKLPQPEKYELNAHDHLQEPTSGRKYSSKRYAYIYRNGAANSVTIKRYFPSTHELLRKKNNPKQIPNPNLKAIAITWFSKNDNSVFMSIV